MPLKMFSESNKPFSSSQKNRINLAKPTHIIGIAAGKGGVGKSSITVNLALALKEQGFSVGILDADIYGPSIRKMLPEDHPPQKHGELFIPAICAGIRMISMAYFRSEQEAAVVRAPIANNLIMQFIKQVEWGALDFLLIDFPPGTGDIQLTLTQQANLSGALIVTTPQEVAVLDVRKAMRMFEQVRVPIIGIIENMSYYQPHDSAEKVYLFGKEGGVRLAKEMNTNFLGAIPIDPELSRVGDTGESIFQTKPLSKTVKVFLNLATQLEKLCSKPDTLLIKNIMQYDKNSFRIEWSDGKQQDFRLSQLQRLCPCAGCVDENTGIRKVTSSQIDDNVKAIRINNVGRYALKIHFETGCSMGIYTYDMLRSI